jgi:hypothetical protein
LLVSIIEDNSDIFQVESAFSAFIAPMRFIERS